MIHAKGKKAECAHEEPIEEITKKKFVKYRQGIGYQVLPKEIFFGFVILLQIEWHCLT